MEKFTKFNFKFALLILLCVAFVLSLGFAMSFSNGIVYAEDCQMVFPNEQYIQSLNPTLVSANENYLLIYDGDLSTLFVNGDSTTVKYILELSDIEYIYAVDEIAFIKADSKYYTLDITDISAEPQEVTLPSPSNIFSVKTDGKYLYAKSVAGYMSIYNSDMTIAFSAENIYMDQFAGKINFVGSENKVYTFTTNFGLPYISMYDFSTLDVDEVQITSYIQDAYLGDNLFALINSEISILDIATGNVLIETEITPTSFCAYGNKLITIEDQVVSTYTFDFTSNTYTKSSAISMSGNDNKHLNVPKSLLKVSDTIIVADSFNNRLGFIDGENSMQTLALEGSPIALTYNNNSQYVLCSNNKIYKIQDMQVMQNYDIEDALDIAYLDKLYALKNDGLYTLIGGQFVKFKDILGAKFIATNINGKNLYVSTNDSLYVISKNSTTINSIDLDFSNIKDLAVDYKGNIYTLVENQINYYINNIYSLDLDKTFAINSEYEITPSSFFFDGEKVYITCNESLILSNDFGYSTKENYSDDEYTINNESYSYASMNKDTFIFDTFFNIDSIKKCDTTIIKIYNKIINDDFCLAENKDGFIIVNKNDFDKINETKNINIYKTNETSSLIESFINNTKVEINEGVELTALSQIKVENLDYIKTSYNDKVYYISLDNLDLVKEIIDDPTEDEPSNPTAKVKANRIGKKVNLYSAPSTSSNIIESIMDGKKVTILEESDEFVHVLYNNVEGFILKENVQYKGLTPTQILAIILSLVVFFAGSTIFVSVYYYKKKSAK